MMDVALRVLNGIVAILTIITGVLLIIILYFKSILFGLYCILFGAILIVTDFSNHLHDQFLFLESTLGRGLFYLFLATFTIESTGYGLIAGVVIYVIAIIFFICHFVPQLPKYPKHS
jgi:uncharacterized membrane protein HdeD (DUF308 family)